MKSVDEMSVFELSRWCALFNAINVIGEECEERNIDFNTLKLSPISLDRYINNTCDQIAKNIINERKSQNKNIQIFDHEKALVNEGIFV